jgi:predicted nucleic acid-binding protein
VASNPVELADTSAWTSRHLDSDLAAIFAILLDEGRIATAGPVRYELLFAARNAEEFAARTTLLDTLPQIQVSVRDWDRAEDVMHALAQHGPLHHRQIPLPDLLIAAAAERADVPVLHYDRDFDLIASITGQPVRAIAPLGSL